MTARRNLAASIRQRLLNLSRERAEDFQLVLTRYAVERLLYRLSRSSYHSEFLLKGAMLFALWSDMPHRRTSASPVGIFFIEPAIRITELPHSGLP